MELGSEGLVHFSGLAELARGRPNKDLNNRDNNAALQKAIAGLECARRDRKSFARRLGKIATLNEARRLISQPDVESQYPSLVVRKSCFSIADY